MDNPKKNAEGYNDPTPYEAEKHIRAQIRGKQARLAGSYFEAILHREKVLRKSRHLPGGVRGASAKEVRPRE